LERRAFHKLAGLAGLDLMLGHPGTALGLQSSSRSNASAISRSPWDGYLIGAAYYPEWWPSKEWEIDFRQMRDLGINTVRMGEFAWALFEPAPGKLEFDWMDRALRVASRYGIRAVLATPTASIPPWLFQLHSDVLSGNSSGPFTYGGRKGYNTNSPNYLAASKRITTALADHYGAIHPSLAGNSITSPAILRKVSTRSPRRPFRRGSGSATVRSTN
jgi:glycosyl hydrolase family 42 (putative beta-galactosidase)